MLLHGLKSGARSCQQKDSLRLHGRRNTAVQVFPILSHLLLQKNSHAQVSPLVVQTTVSVSACWVTPSLLLAQKSRSVTSCLAFSRVKIVGARVIQNLQPVPTWATLVVVQFSTVTSGSLMVRRSGHLLVTSQTTSSFLHVLHQTK